MAGKKVLVVDDEKLIVKGIRFVWNRTTWKWIVLMTVRKHCRWRITRNMTSYYWTSCCRS